MLIKNDKCHREEMENFNGCINQNFGVDLWRDWQKRYYHNLNVNHHWQNSHNYRWRRVGYFPSPSYKDMFPEAYQNQNQNQSGSDDD